MSEKSYDSINWERLPKTEGAVDVAAAEAARRRRLAGSPPCLPWPSYAVPGPRGPRGPSRAVRARIWFNKSGKALLGPAAAPGRQGSAH